jgi:hypothetical protein
VTSSNWAPENSTSVVAPPKPITVWSFDGDCLRSGATTLVEFSGAQFDEVTLTTFT